jgi:hypothetical protein
MMNLPYFLPLEPEALSMLPSEIPTDSSSTHPSAVSTFYRFHPCSESQSVIERAKRTRAAFLRKGFRSLVDRLARWFRGPNGTARDSARATLMKSANVSEVGTGDLGREAQTRAAGTEMTANASD